MNCGDFSGRVALALLSMQRHSWEQGTAMQAFLEMGEMNVVTAMALESVYRAMPDGRAATIGVTDGVTDPCAVGEALERAAKLTDDPVLRRGADALRVWALVEAPRSESGVLYHLTTGRQFWADSLYMLPPYLAAIGEYDKAMINFYGYWDALFDKDALLLCHIWDDGKKEFAHAAHWGSGNGWALAAIARMMALLPESREEDRRELTRRGVTLLDSVLRYMEPDGSFHDMVDDATSFRELNLSQMAAYTIFRGMRDGWLPRRYAEAARLMRHAAREAVDSYGIVHQVCGAPTFDKPGQSPEAQAFALMLENAASAYENKEKGE